MSRAPSFCAVILAAGNPTPTDTAKALRPWPPASAGATQSSGQTLLSTSIAALNRFADMVLVVTGTGESALAPVVYASGGVLVQNPDYAPGFFSALQVGLREVLNRGRDAAILTLVDKPPVRGATLKTLLAEFENAVSNEKWAAVPEYQGVQGYPLLLGREMIEAFLRAPAHANAGDIQHENQARVVFVPVDDPLVAANVNTPEEYAALGVPR